MKIKLYKGPKHGKTYEVRDRQSEVVFAAYRRDWDALASMRPDEAVPVATTEHRYEQVFIYIPGRGMVPSVHPDGSFFFEYKK